MTPEERAAWLKQRRSAICATDVARIMEIPPHTWGGPFQVWLEKMGLDEQRDEPWLAAGRLLEPCIGLRWAAEHDRPVSPATFVRASAPHDWAGATPDFWVGGTGALLEAKTAPAWDRKKWGPDGADATEATVPPHYVVQIHWQMFATGVRDATLAVLFIPPDLWDWLPKLSQEDAVKLAGILAAVCELRSYPVPRDEELIVACAERCRAWWRRHIVGGERPDLDGSGQATGYLRRTFDNVEDDRVELGGDAQRLAMEYVRERANELGAKKSKTLAAQKLQAMLGNHKRGTAGAYDVLWSAGETRRFRVTERGT